jgi:hypothetical protein
MKLHSSQLPISATNEEITFRDEVGSGDMIDMTFSGDGTRFIRAEISDGEPESDWTPIKLRDAVPMLQTVKRHGDWYNPNTKRFLGFWTPRN